MLTEERFSQAEAVAKAFDEAVSRLARDARALLKAARNGDHQRLKELPDRIAAAVAGLPSVAGTWELTDEEVTALLRDPAYLSELRAVAASRGLRLDQLEETLVAFPAMLRVIHDSRVVRLGGKRLALLRPTAVIDAILRARRSSSITPPKQFVEALYKAARLVDAEHLATGVRLSDVHEVLRLHPRQRSYGAAEFALDLHELDVSEVSATRSGAQITLLQPSTGSRGKDAYALAGRDGTPRAYQFVRFEEPAGG